MIYVKSLAEEYDELIAAVESKYEGESRHETALRYIKEREHSIKIEGTKENWENGLLGRDERYV